MGKQSKKRRGVTSTPQDEKTSASGKTLSTKSNKKITSGSRAGTQRKSRNLKAKRANAEKSFSKITNESSNGTNNTKSLIDRLSPEAQKNFSIFQKFKKHVAEKSKFISASEFAGVGKIMRVEEIGLADIDIRDDAGHVTTRQVVQLRVFDLQINSERLWNVSSIRAVNAIEPYLSVDKLPRTIRVWTTGTGMNTRYFAEDTIYLSHIPTVPISKTATTTLTAVGVSKSKKNTKPKSKSKKPTPKPSSKNKQKKSPKKSAGSSKKKVGLKIQKKLTKKQQPHQKKSKPKSQDKIEVQAHASSPPSPLENGPVHQSITPIPPVNTVSTVIADDSELQN
jgi:hypothetical protein